MLNMIVFFPGKITQQLFFYFYHRLFYEFSIIIVQTIVSSMKQYFTDPIIIIMSLAAVYLLGFIGVALLCILIFAHLFFKTKHEIKHEKRNSEN